VWSVVASWIAEEVPARAGVAGASSDDVENQATIMRWAMAVEATFPLKQASLELFPSVFPVRPVPR
jgi:hypothetical protein